MLGTEFRRPTLAFVCDNDFTVTPIAPKNRSSPFRFFRRRDVRPYSCTNPDTPCALPAWAAPASPYPLVIVSAVRTRVSMLEWTVYATAKGTLRHLGSDCHRNSLPEQKLLLQEKCLIRGKNLFFKSLGEFLPQKVLQPKFTSNF